MELLQIYITGSGRRTAEAESVRITPDPCMSMCRAAALAVRRWIVVPIMIGRLKSSSEISRSDVPERRAAKLSRVPARAQADVPRRVRKLDRAANRANQHAWPNLRPYAGEVLVSGPAASMLEGSHLRLEDAGEHELKGLPGRRRVCRLTEASVQARR